MSKAYDPESDAMDNDSTVAEKFPCIRVSGAAASRGKQLGERTRQQIEHSLDTYQQLFFLCDIAWTEAVDKARRYLKSTQQLSAAFIEELQGVATGSATDFDSLFALNCRTEILPADFLTRVLSNDKHGQVAQPTAPMLANECTSFACSADAESSWLVQNWDWCGLQRQAMCVVDAQNDAGHRYLSVTEAGMLAKIGINSAGFAVTLNILRSENDGKSSGTPVHVLLRVLLDCQSVSQARELIAGLSFSSSSNVMVADASGAMASFELSPMGSRELEADNGSLCHTNHFLHEDLSASDVGRTGNQSTLNRLNCARSLICASMTMDDIKAVLSDQSDGLASICRFPDTSVPRIAQIETVCSVIMNLSKRTLAVSSAQPSCSSFTHYTFNH